MNAELVIKSKYCDKEISDFLFSGKCRDNKWYVVSLIIDGNKISSIVQAKIDTIYEIFKIDDNVDSFKVDHNRLNYLLHKYRNHDQFVDLKKILRRVVRYGVNNITVKKINN